MNIRRLVEKGRKSHLKQNDFNKILGRNFWYSQENAVLLKLDFNCPKQRSKF